MRWLLMPGLDGTGSLFEPLLACLPNGVEPQVVSYSGWKIQNYEELLQFVLPGLPEKEPFAIVAESFSGPLAFGIASHCPPPNLKAVILCATFVTCPPIAYLLAPVRSFVFRLPLPRWVARIFLYGGNASPEVVALLYRALDATPAALMAGRLRAIPALDSNGSLEKPAVPLLYLQGSRDRLVPKSAARSIQQHAPQTKVQTIDAPHLLLQTKPAQAVAAIQLFLAEARIDAKTFCV
jgi:pimeloyl-ACP methyl ester carboxylesterase